MGGYRRTYPRFSLCGLSCGLCPMYHISEENHCTGCGGEGRPTCAIIRCSLEHGGPEYCVRCEDYPCERYREEAPYDSFVPGRNVKRDFERLKTVGEAAYQAMLDEKTELLNDLLAHDNDGRRKSFFCTAVNLLELEDVRELTERLKKEPEEPDPKRRANRAVKRFQDRADERGISLKLRKKPKGTG